MKDFEMTQLLLDGEQLEIMVHHQQFAGRYIDYILKMIKSKFELYFFLLKRKELEIFLSC